MFKKILIANRGVIATRILKTCKELGIQTVAIYTPEDKESFHVKEADESVCIRSYKEFPELISVGLEKKIEAIHPGVGFLSENIDFANVIKHYFTFIGPSPETMQLMGNKIEAKRIARMAEVPVIPGSEGGVSDVSEAIKLGDQIGYPLIIKAAAGGGGMGIEKVFNERQLTRSFEKLQNDAKRLFGSDEVFVEKLIQSFKHIEVQILGDKYGNVVHLGERDCTIQRKNQKLIEFTPSGLENNLRYAIAESAVKLAKAIKYENAGTIEFLVEGNNHYFMEMNTRIQVEHRITEMITGIDIIKKQIKAANGETLGYNQSDIKFNGYSIECRINAEDPAKNFEASPGIVTKFVPPTADYILVGSYIPVMNEKAAEENGFKISHSYDSLIANLIVLGKDKEEAKQRMINALNSFVIEGKDVKTTIPYHLEKVKEL